MDITILLLAFLLTSCAARIYQRDEGVVRVPLSRYLPTNISSVQKRQHETPLPQFQGEIYFIQVQVGTPPQSTFVQLDTGSNELWVDPECATSGDPSECSTLGFYNPATSSTADNTGIPFEIMYGKGNVTGTYYIDTVLLAGASLPTTQFGVGVTSSFVFGGVMGVCFGFPYNTDYNNIIDQLAGDNQINSKLFSLALGSVSTAAGEIVLGGVDTMKYSGALTKVPIIFPGPDFSVRYWVTLTSVGNTEPGTSTSKLYTPGGYSLDVILDSGTTLTLLPPALFSLILADFPGAVLLNSGVYSVPCTYATQSGLMDFGFGNVIISVPYSQFIWQPVPGTCVLGVLPMPATLTVPILGDTFLRGAYVVYDQDSVAVFLANYVDCGSNVVAVPAGNGAALQFKGQCASSTTTTSSSTTTSTTTTSSSTVTTTTTSSTTTSSSTTTTSSSSTTSTTSSTTASTSSTTSSSKSSTLKMSTTSTSSSTFSTSKSHFPLPTNGCSRNKCLRALLNRKDANAAYKYCNSFLATTVPPASTSAVPKYLSNCGPTSVISALSSACPCFLASFTSAPPLPKPTQCNQNNCLRALENKANALSAYSFCNSFLATTMNAASPTGIPSYLSNCGPSTSVSALSSACPCFLATFTPPVTTV